MSERLQVVDALEQEVRFQKSEVLKWNKLAVQERERYERLREELDLVSEQRDTIAEWLDEKEGRIKELEREVSRLRDQCVALADGWERDRARETHANCTLREAARLVVEACATDWPGPNPWIARAQRAASLDMLRAVLEDTA